MARRHDPPADRRDDPLALAEPPGAAPSLVFIHLPKTAGSTLRRVLERQYPEGSIFRMDGFSLQGSWDRLAGLAHSGGPTPEVVLGHMPFGVHGALHPGRCRYVTLVRHPVERLVSHFGYVSRTPQSALHDEVARERLSLRHYVEGSRMAPLVNDGQTRLLGAADFVSAPPATEETLTRAKVNIEAWFEVAAPTDRFDEAVILMRRRFGWGWPTYLPQKVSPGRRGPLDAETERAILERNRLDLELYRFVAERFEGQAGKEGKGFGDEVVRFRRRNARFREGYAGVREPNGR